MPLVIALYLTRFNQISAIEKIQPQFRAVATSFDPGD
jgi:hypothetical protein